MNLNSKLVWWRIEYLTLGSYNQFTNHDTIRFRLTSECTIPIKIIQHHAPERSCYRLKILTSRNFPWYLIQGVFMSVWISHTLGIQKKSIGYVQITCWPHRLNNNSLWLTLNENTNHIVRDKRFEFRWVYKWIYCIATWHHN